MHKYNTIYDMCYEKVTCNMLQMQHIIFVIKSVEQHFGNSLFSYLFKKMNNAIYPIEEDPVLNDKLDKKKIVSYAYI